MMFKLKRPCDQCPFRRDIAPFLTRARVEELQHELEVMGNTFSCHKTVDYSVEPDAEDGCSFSFEELTEMNRNAQHCAGAAILLEKLERPNSAMQISERMVKAGYIPATSAMAYSREELDMNAPVFDTFAEMKEAQHG